MPEICSDSVQPLTSNLYQPTFAACANQSLISTQQIAWLYFTAVTNQSSGFMELNLANVTGQQPDGTPVGNFAPQSGNVVMVAAGPLLEARRGTNDRVVVTLYGHLGQTNVLQTSTNLALPGAWVWWQEAVFTNLFLEVDLPAVNETNVSLFLRAYRP